MSNVGDRIRRLRERHGISQLHLSKKIGINNSVLSRIESGKRPIEDDELNAFADFFEVSADYLLGRVDNPSPQTTEKTVNINNPELNIMFKNLKDATPQIQEETRKFLEFLMEKEKNRKSGDRQGE